jgi:hypothetical protein
MKVDLGQLTSTEGRTTRMKTGTLEIGTVLIPSNPLVCMRSLTHSVVVDIEYSEGEKIGALTWNKEPVGVWIVTQENSGEWSAVSRIAWPLSPNSRWQVFDEVDPYEEPS